MKTHSYRIPRLRLAYLASEEYVRTLWWMAGTIPLFGILMIAMGRGILQVIGFSALIWPISLPSRGILWTSNKQGSLFVKGCFADLDDEFLTFYDTSGRPTPLRWRIPLYRVRDVVQRQEFYLVRIRKLGFAAIPVSAFESDEDRSEFLRTIARAVEDRFAAQQSASSDA